jgi:hypothetical protein
MKNGWKQLLIVLSIFAVTAVMILTTRIYFTGKAVNENSILSEKGIMAGDTECLDVMDNDYDGLIDMNDEGCNNETDDEWGGNLVDGWTIYTPTPYNTSIYSLTNINQPGSRIFYISGEGNDNTGEIYFWNGSHVVNSLGESFGADPLNPIGDIKSFYNWSYVAPRG